MRQNLPIQLITRIHWHLQMNEDAVLRMSLLAKVEQKFRFDKEIGVD